MERMVLIAAFAVSAYGSSHFRAAHKPFNPLLGETYECVREDKGFKYVSEQVPDPLELKPLRLLQDKGFKPVTKSLQVLLKPSSTLRTCYLSSGKLGTSTSSWKPR